MPVVQRKRSDRESHRPRGRGRESEPTLDVEAALRDAVAFAESADVPEGIAHRALAAAIARQDVRSHRPERLAANRGWLAGLSLGTVAGAAATAAVMLVLHPMHSVVSIAAAPATVSGGRDAHLAVADAGPRVDTGLTAAPASLEYAAPWDAAPARSGRVHSVSEPAGVADALRGWTRHALSRRHSSGALPARVRHYPLADGAVFLVRTAPTPIRVAYRHGPATTPRRDAEPPPATAEIRPTLVRCEAETVDRTDYQLLATGYVATPIDSGEQLATPVRLRAELEPSVATDGNGAPISTAAYTTR
jgi:hypothetical protein